MSFKSLQKTQRMQEPAPRQAEDLDVKDTKIKLRKNSYSLATVSRLSSLIKLALGIVCLTVVAGLLYYVIAHVYMS